MNDKKNNRLQDVFENVEYLTIVKNKQQLMLLENMEINGKSRTELQKLIGQKLGGGVYSYTVKYFNQPKVITGRITALLKEPKPAAADNKTSDLENKLISRLASLEERINQQGSADSSFKDILAMKDAAFQIQIDFYKNLAEQYKQENISLRKQLESGEAGGGLNQLLEAAAPLIMQFVQPKPGA